MEGGVWSEVDIRDCVSILAQQFLVEAESIRAGHLMNIHELLYSMSGVRLYTSSVVGGGSGGEVSVTGGDLRAVGRYMMEVARLLVESAHGPVTEDHRQLLEVSRGSVLLYTIQ